MVAARLEGPHALPEGLRHGFGVAAVSAGIPLNLVQKWLGHAQLTRTAICADGTMATIGAKTSHHALRAVAALVPNPMKSEFCRRVSNYISGPSAAVLAQVAVSMACRPQA